MSESSHLPADEYEGPTRRRARRSRRGAADETPVWARVDPRDAGPEGPTTDSSSSRRDRAGKVLQRQLMVGEEDHPAEREANQVADSVASTTPAGTTTEPAVKTAAEAAEPFAVPAAAMAVTATPVVGTEAGEDEEPLQMSPVPGRGRVAPDWQDRVHDGLRGGRPLPEADRADVEQRTGVDLSDVRLHDDQAADRAARAVGARAFTVGDDVAFRSGEYRPHTDAGRRLLAHELTHVVQQRGGTRSVAHTGAHTAAHTAARRGAPSGGAVVRRAISPEDVSSEMVGRDFEASIAITISGVTLKAGTKLTTRSGSTPA